MRRDLGGTPATGLLLLLASGPWVSLSLSPSLTEAAASPAVLAAVVMDGILVLGLSIRGPGRQRLYILSALGYLDISISKPPQAASRDWQPSTRDTTR